MGELQIEIVFASKERQTLKTLSVESGATVADVVATSGVLDDFPDQCIEQLTFGVWGRVVAPTHAVRDGDRVELYRALELDPREARRQLALVGRTMGSAEAD